MDSLKNELQRTLDGAFPFTGCPYDRVVVLILYWLEDDFRPSCAEEAQKVLDLFSKDFHYETEIFQIPSYNSQNLLEQAVVNFKCANDSDSSLLIVYYTGHGDPDEARGKAVWAAKTSGAPTLDWFQIQPTLEHAQGDVLLIFDCCHASLAAKGRGEGRLELLAAAPGDGKTPRPGPFSFTQFFVEVTKKALQERNGLRVFELPNLIYQYSEQTPVYLNLRTDSQNSILLRPLPVEASSSIISQSSKITPMGTFSFTISVIEPPSMRSVRQLGEWIKSSAPKTVSAVKVDNIIDLSNSLQEFVLDDDKAGLKGRFVDSLSSADRALVMCSLRGIGEVVANARVNPLFPSAQIAAATAGVQSIKTQNIGMRVLQEVEEHVSKLSRTIWGLIFNHPAYQTSSELERLQQNPVAQKAGISEAARLSLLAREMTVQPEPDAVYIPPGNIVYKRLMKNEDQFLIGRLAGQAVILDIVRPALDGQKLSPEILKRRLKRIHSLLTNSKPNFFRIPRCIGFTCEKQEAWYGFVFELPPGVSQCLSLRSIFKRDSRVPLEIRYRLAHTVAASLGGLHSVHWVHKGIRCDNILFFNQDNSMGQVLHDEPWLFGFGDTREDAEISSNQADYRLERRVYLPPSRWGTPSEKFSYRHDIYALGVLLLEIGLWGSALQLDRKRFENVLKPEEAQTLLVERAGVDLCHIMGTMFSKVVLACLNGEVKGQKNRSLNFQVDVLDILNRLARFETPESDVG